MNKEVGDGGDPHSLGVTPFPPAPTSPLPTLPGPPPSHPSGPACSEARGEPSQFTGKPGRWGCAGGFPARGPALPLEQVHASADTKSPAWGVRPPGSSSRLALVSDSSPGKCGGSGCRQPSERFSYPIDTGTHVCSLHTLSKGKSISQTSPGTQRAPSLGSTSAATKRPTTQLQGPRGEPAAGMLR